MHGEAHLKLEQCCSQNGLVLARSVIYIWRTAPSRAGELRAVARGAEEHRAAPSGVRAAARTPQDMVSLALQFRGSLLSEGSVIEDHEKTV